MGEGGLDGLQVQLLEVGLDRRLSASRLPLPWITSRLPTMNVTS
jgi:hypothetical protein